MMASHDHAVLQQNSMGAGSDYMSPLDPKSDAMHQNVPGEITIIGDAQVAQ